MTPCAAPTFQGWWENCGSVELFLEYRFVFIDTVISDGGKCCAYEGERSSYLPWNGGHSIFQVLVTPAVNWYRHSLWHMLSLRCILWSASASLSCDVTPCPSDMFLYQRRLKKAPIDDEDSCSRETLAARQACPSRSCAPRVEELEILMERRVVAQIARHKAQSKLVRGPPKAC